MRGYSIEAQDGEIGMVDDFYFDDRAWLIRYMIIKLGGWFKRKEVLISPASFKEPRSSAFPLDLTREQIENSPDIDTGKPVSRQNEHEMQWYFGWPNYGGYFFGGTGTAGPTNIGNTVPPFLTEVDPQNEEDRDESDPHLRSSREVSGYHIHATDGTIGHLDDYVLDTDHWVVRYLVVNTSNWIGGKKVIVSPEWVESIEWPDSIVKVGHSREEIGNSPEYDPAQGVDRALEEKLYDHYGRKKYWS
jgi:uncharacterized protein YrrD